MVWEGRRREAPPYPDSAGHMKSTTITAWLTVTVLCTGCCAAKDHVKADSTPSDVPFLIEQTHSENADTRGRAAFALEKIGTEASQAIPVLTALLQDKDEHVRAAAASALRVFGANAKGAVSPLIGNLNDPYFGARSYAAAALGMIGPDAKDAVPHLMERLQNDKGEPQRNALWALGEIGPDSLQAVPSIIKMLEQGERELRIMAIDTLGKIRPGEEDVIRKLAGRITQKDTEMNRHIVTALEHIGAPAVQDLMKLVTHEDAEIRVLAICSLGEVGPDAKGAIPLLAEAQNDHQAAGPMLASATAPRTVGDWARIALKKIEQKERPSNQRQKATGKPAP